LIFEFSNLELIQQNFLIDIKNKKFVFATKKQQ